MTGKVAGQPRIEVIFRNNLAVQHKGECLDHKTSNKLVIAIKNNNIMEEEFSGLEHASIKKSRLG